MSVVQRKKHSTKKCRDCKFYNDGWCDLFFSRHDAMTPRCKDDYEAAVPWYKSGRFWFFASLGVIMVIGVVSKLTGG